MFVGKLKETAGGVFITTHSTRMKTKHDHLLTSSTLLIFVNAYFFFALEPAACYKQVRTGATKDWEVMECSISTCLNVPQVRRLIGNRSQNGA